MIMIPIQCSWTQHKNTKAEIGMMEPTCVGADQQSMQVALCVSLSQIGTGWIKLGVIFTPDQIIFGRFQTTCDFAQFRGDYPGDGVVQILIMQCSFVR